MSSALSVVQFAARHHSWPVMVGSRAAFQTPRRADFDTARAPAALASQAVSTTSRRSRVALPHQEAI